MLLLTVAVLLQSSNASAQPAAPTGAGQSSLIKNTLTALNHATITGNYTVLRDLGSDAFRARYNAADLAVSFSELRNRRIDLGAVLAADPVLTQLPVLDDTNRLRLVGYAPTHPQSIRFDLSFRHERGGWTIDEVGLAIDEPKAPAVSRRVPEPSTAAPTATCAQVPQRRRLPAATGL